VLLKVGKHDREGACSLSVLKLSLTVDLCLKSMSTPSLPPPREAPPPGTDAVLQISSTAFCPSLPQSCPGALYNELPHSPDQSGLAPSVMQIDGIKMVLSGSACSEHDAALPPAPSPPAVSLIAGSVQSVEATMEVDKETTKAVGCISGPCNINKVSVPMSCPMNPEPPGGRQQTSGTPRCVGTGRTLTDGLEIQNGGEVPYTDDRVLSAQQHLPSGIEAYGSIERIELEVQDPKTAGICKSGEYS